MPRKRKRRDNPGRSSFAASPGFNRLWANASDRYRRCSVVLGKRTVPLHASQQTIIDAAKAELTGEQDLVELSKQGYFTIMLDKNLRVLASGLEDDGFKVVMSQQELKDDALEAASSGLGHPHEELQRLHRRCRPSRL
jgi:hypothetical protein